MARVGTDLDGLPGRIGTARVRAENARPPALRELRVATWNVHEGLPAAASTRGRDDAPADLVELVDRHDIDILALQEVDFDERSRSRVLDRIAEGTALTEMAEYPCSPSSFFPHARAGVAIASRFPIRWHKEHELLNPNLRATVGEYRLETFDKGVLTCGIDVAGRDVIVMSLHMFPFHLFGRRPDDETFQPVWRQLRDHVASFDDRRLVVAGDFNSGDRRLPLGPHADAFTSTVGDQATHRGFAADDILCTGLLRAAAQATVVPNFSDHALCVARLTVG